MAGLLPPPPPGDSRNSVQFSTLEKSLLKFHEIFGECHGCVSTAKLSLLDMQEQAWLSMESLSLPLEGPAPLSCAELMQVYKEMQNKMDTINSFLGRLYQIAIDVEKKASGEEAAVQQCQPTGELIKKMDGAEHEQEIEMGNVQAVELPKPPSLSQEDGLVMPPPAPAENSIISSEMLREREGLRRMGDILSAFGAQEGKKDQSWGARWARRLHSSGLVLTSIKNVKELLDTSGVDGFLLALNPTKALWRRPTVERLHLFLNGEADIQGHRLHIVCSRQDLEGEGENVLFTAPHSITLARDGHPDHKREDHTRALALAWAHQLRGGAVAWAPAETRRVGRAPDPANRDPNYLRRGEVARSPWLAAQRAAADPRRGPCLHVDVHGMSRARHGGRDAVASVACVADAGDRERLRGELEARLAAALAGGGGGGGGGWRLDCRYKRLTGKWPAAGGRCSQTQVSTGWLGARWAVQLELSLPLRRALAQDAALRAGVGEALIGAWRAAVAARPAAGEGRGAAEGRAAGRSPLVATAATEAMVLEGSV